jgi:Zn-dependent protease/CBS domain-containing protein
MRWSWMLGRLAGIEIRVHATFALLLGWIAIAEYMQKNTLAAAIGGIAFVLAVFATVVLHELGHALVARRFGIRTRDITLLPIGGVARLERMPERPGQELLVAVAGPTVSVAIGLMLLGILALTRQSVSLAPAQLMAGPFLGRLMWVNFTLALFNLLPAFPMDGGRMLRALLATRMGRSRATAAAARVGQGIAFLLGILGLLYSPFLVFIALFVWIGAAQEAAEVQLRAGLAGIPVESAMIREFHVLAPGDPLSVAVDHLLQTSQHDFPVVQDARLVGVLTRAGLIRWLARRETAVSIGDAMERVFETATTSEMLGDVLTRLRASACHTLPVLREGRVVGLVTSENIGEFVMVQAALSGHAGGRGPRWPRSRDEGPIGREISVGT